jgi:cytoskeletal protein RodZ
MTDLGARLRRAREERGFPLKDIAARTKISVTALEALERNDLTRLPGGIFGRAFVRAYAVELGLDADHTVAEFQAGLEESERLRAERGAIRVEITDDDREFLERQRRALRALRVVVVVVVVAAAVLLAWRFRTAW